MAKMVPLIGSSEAGPLGAMHLPRLWLKVSLATAGALNDEYDECGAGFDQMVLDGLGVDRDAALEFLRSSKPSYPEFEQWVVDQNGRQHRPVGHRRFQRGNRRLQPRRRHRCGDLGGGQHERGRRDHGRRDAQRARGLGGAARRIGGLASNSNATRGAGGL